MSDEQVQEADAPQPESDSEEMVKLAVISVLVSAWRASDGTNFDRVGVAVPASKADDYLHEAASHDVRLNEVQ